MVVVHRLEAATIAVDLLGLVQWNSGDEFAQGEFAIATLIGPLHQLELIADHFVGIQIAIVVAIMALEPVGGAADGR